MTVHLGVHSKVYRHVMALKVSDLAGKVGVSTDTIRYYERLGLLPPAERTSSGYRQYEQGSVRRIQFIKDAQSLGLTLAEIGELLKIQDDGACPCGHTKAMLEKRLDQVNREIETLLALREELASLGQLECFPVAGGSTWPCEIQFPKSAKGGEPMTNCECGPDCCGTGECTCDCCK